MATMIDSFAGDGVNTIFRTSKRYSTGSLILTITEDATSTVTSTTFIELGEQYLQTPSPIQIGYTLKITYTIFGSLGSDSQEEYDMLKRIKDLEGAVESLYVLNKANLEALNKRVNITAFQAWLKLVEKKTGIKLIDENLGIIDKELYK